MVKYTRHSLDDDKAAYARGDDVGTSFKNSVETLHTIRGMDLQEAKSYLEDVLAHKRCVPFRHFNGGVGRTGQAKEWGTDQGRWPEKSVRIILGLLNNAEANAKAKDLDPDTLYVWHCQANEASKGRRRCYRAHGRVNPFMSNPCHLELILQVRKQAVPEAEADQQHKKVRLGKK